MELIELVDIYKERDVPVKDSEGNILGYNKEVKPYKRALKLKWECDRRDITNIKEILTQFGKIKKNTCQVYHKPENKWITILGDYRAIREKLTEKNKIGYK